MLVYQRVSSGTEEINSATVAFVFEKPLQQMRDVRIIPAVSRRAAS
jgi:hypothetical protein